MDQLANVAKFVRFENDKGRLGNFNRPSILPNSGNYRQEEFLNWWNNLVKDYQINQEALSGLVFGKDVTLQVTGKDRYGLTLAVVMVGGVNANLIIVRFGFAWRFDKSSRDRGTAGSAERRERGKAWTVW